MDSFLEHNSTFILHTLEVVQLVRKERQTRNLQYLREQNDLCICPVTAMQHNWATLIPQLQSFLNKTTLHSRSPITKTLDPVPHLRPLPCSESIGEKTETSATVLILGDCRHKDIQP